MDSGSPSSDSGTTGEASADTGTEAIVDSSSASDAAPDSSTHGDAACNEGGAGGGTCTSSTPPFVSCADLATPTVSYAADVQPVFNQSCGIAGGTCHGDPNIDAKTTGQVFLGLPDGGTSAGQVVALLVGQPSAEDPQMNLVTAGDPAHSFLMHKLDYDQCLYAAACNATMNAVFANCGIGQPYNSGILDLATRDTIRRWIAQGAKDN